jgi:hypothetical protein
VRPLGSYLGLLITWYIRTRMLRTERREIRYITACTNASVPKLVDCYLGKILS